VAGRAGIPAPIHHCYGKPEFLLTVTLA